MENPQSSSSSSIRLGLTLLCKPALTNLYLSSIDLVEKDVGFGDLLYFVQTDTAVVGGDQWG